MLAPRRRSHPGQEGVQHNNWSGCTHSAGRGGPQHTPNPMQPLHTPHTYHHAPAAPQCPRQTTGWWHEARLGPKRPRPRTRQPTQVNSHPQRPPQTPRQREAKEPWVRGHKQREGGSGKRSRSAGSRLDLAARKSESIHWRNGSERWWGFIISPRYQRRRTFPFARPVALVRRVLWPRKKKERAGLAQYPQCVLAAV